MYYQLTPEQREFWKQYGYLKIDDFILPSQKSQLAEWTDDLASWPETPGKWMKYFEHSKSGAKQLCRIEYLIDFHPEFRELISGKRTQQLIANLMDEPGVLFKEKINFKLPGGNGFTPHQDAPAFVSFDQKYHITFMVAIDDATIENGCLQVAPETRQVGTILQQDQAGSIHDSVVKNLNWQPVECPRGTVLLFDSYLPHYSEANLSNQSRRAIFATFNRFSEGGDKREAYYQDKREKFPPECERDPNKDYSAGAAIYNIANPIPVNVPAE